MEEKLVTVAISLFIHITAKVLQQIIAVEEVSKIYTNRLS